MHGKQRWGCFTIQRIGLDTLHELGACPSYLIQLDNISRMSVFEFNEFGKYIVGKGGYANKHSYMDNSTTGFATDIIGLPRGFSRSLLPTKWLDHGGQCKLVSSDIAPSEDSMNTYESLCRLAMADTQRN